MCSHCGEQRGGFVSTTVDVKVSHSEAVKCRVVQHHFTVQDSQPYQAIPTAPRENEMAVSSKVTQPFVWADAGKD